MLRQLVTVVTMSLALTTVAMTTKTGDPTSRLSGRYSEPGRHSRYARANSSVAMATRLYSFQNPAASTDDVSTREPADPCKAAGYLGDIALTDDEFRLVTKITKRNERRYKAKSNETANLTRNNITGLSGNPTKSDRFRVGKNRDKDRKRERISTNEGDVDDDDDDDGFDDDDDNDEEVLKVPTKKKHSRDFKRNERHYSNVVKKDAARGRSSRHGHQKTAKQIRRASAEETEATETEGQAAVGGDRRRQRRAATARAERLWEFGVIPYEIETNFSGSHRALFQQAMRHWENNTCITFAERTPQDVSYIVFTERPCGCCSFVGKRGNGPQAISIGKNCDKFGIVVHELGHVIGFWHEHTRPDRDDHVRILFENIMPTQEYNFNTLTQAEVNSLSEAYDFFSIMHYARNTFARSTHLDTIAPQTQSLASIWHEIGQRVKLSAGDVTQANKLYRCPKCGQTMQESSGAFGHPWPNDNSVEKGPEICQWRISGTHGEKIVVVLTMLDIPDNKNCAVDYLEVRDGHWVRSPTLGRFCGGHQLPVTLTSTNSRAWIEYRRSGGGVYKGFSAKYEAVCGGHITKDNGMLSSPNYPDNYKGNKECIWKLEVSDGYTVALKFQSFEIEAHDHCVYDYLEIRDGNDDSSPLLGKLCGARMPNDVKSTGNRLYVKFVSDGSVQKAGFAATFVKEFDECSTDEHGCHHMCVNTLGAFRCSCNIGYELHSDGKRCEDACGGYIDDASNGTIHSPSFPDIYPPNKNCIWQIAAPKQYRITVNFTHFDLEGNNQDCEYDSVEVRSGIESNTKLHGTFCGSSLPQAITSEGNAIRLTFVTDSTVQKTGFSAVFSTDRDECAVENGGCQHICKNTVGSYHCVCHSGFTLHDNRHDCKESSCQHEVTRPMGEINSPNWPDYYPKESDCIWKFTTTAGHRIKLTFSEFEIESHADCTYDRLEIFDGPGDDSRRLANLCGYTPPGPVISTRRQLFMKFSSDTSVQKRGFSIKHSSVCGGALIASSEESELFSHAKFGDHNYESKEDCTWRIRAEDEALRVRFRFLTFELEEETDCGYDSVEIRDVGKNRRETFLGKYCGATKIPEEFVSRGNELVVIFRTDDTINKKGFSAIFALSTSDVASPVSPTPKTGTGNSSIPPEVRGKSKSHKKLNVQSPSSEPHLI